MNTPNAGFGYTDGKIVLLLAFLYSWHSTNEVWDLGRKINSVHNSSLGINHGTNLLGTHFLNASFRLMIFSRFAEKK